MNNIGITTSVPVEIIFATGKRPVDLNNLFITNENPVKLLEQAERDGFPRNTCSWIKGMYSSIINSKDIDTIIGVIEGDCSNTGALLEVLELKNIKNIPFSFPLTKSYEKLQNQLQKLCDYFNVNFSDVIKMKKQLDDIRKKLVYLDELTYKSNKATGFENHIWQVSSSDFNGDYIEFDRQLSLQIDKIEARKSKNQKIRLGYIGVPPIISSIYDFIETLDAGVVYNEVQRQFTMADGIGNDDIVQVYLNYTYPYGITDRINDINKNIEVRELDGIIHYVQAFCFKGIEDIVFRDKLAVPILTLEGDRPGLLDARTKLRVEAFIEMLKM